MRPGDALPHLRLSLSNLASWGKASLRPEVRLFGDFPGHHSLVSWAAEKASRPTAFSAALAARGRKLHTRLAAKFPIWVIFLTLIWVCLNRVTSAW